MRKSLVLCLGAALLAAACVEVDNSVGQGLIDKSLLFDTYTETLPLTRIQLKSAEALSGYSDTRLTIGAIRDEVFGLTTRDAAFTLIPQADTIDLGENPTAVSFSVYFAADTVSCADPYQESIFQNLYVTELTARLPQGDTRNTQDIAHGEELITEGLPIYNGSGPLRFYFTQEFAQKYVDVLKELGPVLYDRASEEAGKEDYINKYEEYVDRLPGVYIQTDEPDGIGGRINLFKFSSLSVESKYYTANYNVARLKVHSTWKGVQKDSTFIFFPGEPEFYDEQYYIDNNTKFYQYCFNRTSQSTQNGPATDAVLVEGGGGLKPVILGSELKEITSDAIIAKGGDPSKAVIIKATIILPFELPLDYDELDYFPSVLSPTICTKETDSDTGKEYTTFAGLTDASVSSEDQGNVDFANLWYSPDITYHLQELLDRDDLDVETNADIWLLTVHTETVADANGSLMDDAYYQQMLYASYYNSLYGGGYGGYGYGSYGGYGSSSYSYSNYYNYMMLAQMMAASQQQTYSTTTELDKDRYYRAVLNGNNDERFPCFQITFAIPKE